MKCLIYDEMHLSLLPMLEAQGIGADYRPFIRRSEIIAIAGNYEGFIGRSKTALDAELLERAVKLQFIGRGGAGLEDIDLDWCRNNNIAVINAPEGNRDSVGEHTVGMLLCLQHKIANSSAQVKQGLWHREPNRGVEIGGKTIAIIGYGNMGRAFARRLSGFGCKVLAYDKYLSAWPDSFAIQASMEQVFAQAHIVSLHLPLTNETNFLVNSQWLEKFSRPIVLLNTSRGKIVRTDHLILGLEMGIITGAALDVLENENMTSLTETEKIRFEKLCSFPNVIITPHIAGWSQESYLKINETLVRKIAEYRKLTLLNRPLVK